MWCHGLRQPDGVPVGAGGGVAGPVPSGIKTATSVNPGNQPLLCSSRSTRSIRKEHMGKPGAFVFFLWALIGPRALVFAQPTQLPAAALPRERPPLFFREDWTVSAAETPITQKHVANDSLFLGLHGPGKDG